jgi:O-antigen ligase
VTETPERRSDATGVPFSSFRDRAFVVLLLPAALTVYFAFSSGGYFVGATGIAAAALAVVLAARVTLGKLPFAGVSPALLVTAAALAFYTLWTLISALVSGAPARALLEYDRALLYLLVLALLGSVPASGARLEAALRAFALGVTVVCFAALLSRVAPDVLPVPASLTAERLSYPVSYWNALGLLAAIGVVVCLHLSSGPRQPRIVRALGAAVIPPLAVVLLLTFSRGAIGIGLFAIVLYAILARPWGIIGTVVAVGPASAVALVTAYDAELLATPEPTVPAAVAQGHELAVVVVLCALGAGSLRALLAGVDARLERRAERSRASRVAHPGWAVAAWAGVAVGVVTLMLALGVPERVERQYDEFVTGSSLKTADTRERLGTFGNNGRVDNWSVALEGFSAAPLLGHGAGTYQVLWSRDRGSDLDVVDGHSLYLEVLAELGLLGLAPLAVAVVTLTVALALRVRGRERSLYAALLAAILAWAVHAGIDWDWEVPAVTVWVFALGGLAIAAPRGGLHAPAPGRLTRIGAALGCLVLAVTPALAALSQARLDESVAAFRRGDCTRTADAALASISFLSVRPQPFELLAYCDVRAGFPQLAVAAMGEALVRDPENWEYQYGLALVRASAGLDPRPQARAAAYLNPLNPLAQEAVRAFDTADPERWERRASEARLPIAR